MSRSPWQKFKDRKVVQWAVGYAAIAWLLLQLADVLGDTFDWSAAALKALTYLLASGVLPVLILAWYHGDRGQQRFTGIEVIGLSTYGI